MQAKMVKIDSHVARVTVENSALRNEITTLRGSLLLFKQVVISRYDPSGQEPDTMSIKDILSWISYVELSDGPRA